MLRTVLHKQWVFEFGFELVFSCSEFDSLLLSPLSLILACSTGQHMESQLESLQTITTIYRSEMGQGTGNREAAPVMLQGPSRSRPIPLHPY